MVINTAFWISYKYWHIIRIACIFASSNVLYTRKNPQSNNNWEFTCPSIPLRVFDLKPIYKEEQKYSLCRANQRYVRFRAKRLQRDSMQQITYSMMLKRESESAKHCWFRWLSRTRAANGIFHSVSASFFLLACHVFLCFSRPIAQAVSHTKFCTSDKKNLHGILYFPRLFVLGIESFFDGFQTRKIASQRCHTYLYLLW